MNRKLITLVFLCSIAIGSFGQKVVTDTISVFGNCGMCKTTIEKSLKKKDGVVSKEWNKETETLVVSYDQELITLDDIHKKVAAVGYDTKKATADDKVYAKLPKCCQYKRASLR